MNFLFVDRIIASNPGIDIQGLKHVTAADCFLSKRSTLFPGIIGEALGQLCSWNVLQTTDFKYRPVGGVVKEIEIFNEAKVNDTIILESRIEGLDLENLFVNFSGHAVVKDKLILTVKNSLAPLLPIEEFNDPVKVRADFEKLDQGYFAPIPDVAMTPYQFNFEIISQTSNEIVAKKQILKEAGFFADHFPRKPVFPLSLLIQYNLHLATEILLSKMKMVPYAVRNVKIGNFVLPGSEVLSKISIKEQHDERIILSFYNEVNNKRVCVAEAELGVVPEFNSL